MAHLDTVASFAAGHPVPAAVLALAVLAIAWLGWRAARKAARLGRQAFRDHKASTEGMLTLAVAGLATAVAVTGMFHFFGVELHDSGAERALFCGVLELAAFAEAVRAKRNMAEHGSAGIDGMAMWALAGLSGVLSAWAAGSLAAAAFRFSMPLVAAWLWHRGLALARRRAGGRSIAWRITPERVLVSLGLADPTGRTGSEAAAQRRLTVLAQAAKRVRALDAAEVTGRRLVRAERRLDAAMTGAVEFAGLAADPGQQEALLAQLGALYQARGLAALDAPAPWDREEEGAAETGDGAVGEEAAGDLDLVVMLGFAAALAHLLRVPEAHPVSVPGGAPEVLAAAVPETAPAAHPAPAELPAAAPAADGGLDRLASWLTSGIVSVPAALRSPSPNGGAHPGTAPSGAPGPRTEGAPRPRLPTAPGVHHETAPRVRTRDRSRARARSAPGTDEDAEREFMSELASGALPSLRQIRTRMRVGQDRAQQIQKHLEDVTAVRT